ncbi:MAG: hypothetical protein COS49_02725 [Candidatus Portnoybacteria bacterium CG03_land_8_20_14_0_80_41_10]|uniref:Ada DNA repair metal-binding domain-containing protein n=1 Tax=Candidatus Portnoybacteria bacterium CG03_land_8_20_14_0_80_41_10 TaxID=1974808 RepID=A0A2M7BU37_9BACT|nr:MAG: hypothetical protein COS49_02725 [Candidatus Portnoybacteria bacterium CG03_land_8_20_14_0_80_41_10]
MLTNFKNFVNPSAKGFWFRIKEHQSDIILTIGITLIALVSFGAGRLTSPQTNQEPIIIQGPTASIEQSLETSQPVEKIGQEKTEQGKFVGSVNSNKYHWPECSSAKKIAPQNQIWFSSEAEARAAGYTRCSYFDKYTPPDYRP